MANPSEQRHKVSIVHGTTELKVVARALHGPLTASGTIVAQIVRAWQLALARRPTQEELETATHFVARQIAYLNQHSNQLPKGISAEKQALTNVCQALLICNEFLYSD